MFDSAVEPDTWTASRVSGEMERDVDAAVLAKEVDVELISPADELCLLRCDMEELGNLGCARDNLHWLGDTVGGGEVGMSLVASGAGGRWRGLAFWRNCGERLYKYPCGLVEVFFP